MIIWLASFPRSGNTLLRQMLRRCFDIQSHSIYNDDKDIAGNPEVRATVGHLDYQGPWPDFYQECRASDETRFIKTHEAPLDDSPAIYVIRHPAHAVRSYARYLEEFAGADSGTIAALFGAGSPFPTWGRHWKLWSPRSRANTLLLRYEDLVDQPGAELERIAGFLDREPKAAWINPFRELRGSMPGFFRRGRTQAEPGATAEDRWIERLNQDAMQEAGYRVSSSDFNDPAIELAASALIRLQDDLADLRGRVSRLNQLNRELKSWAQNAQRGIEERNRTIESLRGAPPDGS